MMLISAAFAAGMGVRTLPNGLAVRTEVEPWLPESVVRLELRHGAAEDPPGAAGLAHLVEHLLFSADRFEDSLDARLAAFGARGEAWTMHESVVLRLLGPPEALPALLELLPEALERGPVSADELSRAKAVVAREAAGAPEPLRLWPSGHPYSRPVLGAGLAGISAADVNRALRRTVGVLGATLILVGPTDPGDLGRIGSIPAGDPRAAAPIPATTPRVVVADGAVIWALPAPYDAGALRALADLLAIDGGSTRVAFGEWGATLRVVGEGSAMARAVRRLDLSPRRLRRVLGRMEAEDRAEGATAAGLAERLARCPDGCQAPTVDAAAIRAFARALPAPGGD